MPEGTGVTRTTTSRAEDLTAKRNTSSCLQALDACASNVQLLSIVDRVVSNFGQHDIQCVALKGVALLHTVYVEDPWARPMVDADLLVPPDRLAQAGQILEQLGFARTPGEQSCYWRGAGTSHVRVDLHDRLWYLDDTRLAQFWKRTTCSESSTLRLPATEDHLILLAAHAIILHGQLRTTWLEDLRRLSAQGLDWHSLVERASSLRLQLPISIALTAVAAVAPQVPAFVLDSLRVTGLDRLRLRPIRFCLRRPETPEVGHLLRLLVPGRGPSCGRRVWRHLFPGNKFLERRYPTSARGHEQRNRLRMLWFLRPYWAARGLFTLLGRVATAPASRCPIGRTEAA